jgi:uncharacterized membrane protein YfcA
VTRYSAGCKKYQWVVLPRKRRKTQNIFFLYDPAFVIEVGKARPLVTNNPLDSPNTEAPIRPYRALLIAPIVWVFWIIGMVPGHHWALFMDNWFMTITMCLGSFIAGATSEGGGAVAFPVMTLLFNIDPPVARDFSLMIQSVGMTAATLTIVFLRIKIEWRAILLASIGGAIGVIIGIEWISPLLPPAFTKMLFTSLWLSFGLTLYWINKRSDRQILTRIQNFRGQHGAMLVAFGILGGIVSGLTGSGVDILTFTLLTLYFRMSEKIATPTSVVLMAINALIGFAWSGGIRGNLSPQAWDYWYVCIPVVVVGAPLGAWFISNRTRRFVASILMLSIIVQFFCSLFIVKQTRWLLLFSASMLVMGLLLFSLLSWAGSRRLNPVAD